MDQSSNGGDDTPRLLWTLSITLLLRGNPRCRVTVCSRFFFRCSPPTWPSSVVSITYLRLYDTRSTDARNYPLIWPTSCSPYPTLVISYRPPIADNRAGSQKTDPGLLPVRKGQCIPRISIVNCIIRSWRHRSHVPSSQPPQPQGILLQNRKNKSSSCRTHCGSWVFVLADRKQ